MATAKWQLVLEKARKAMADAREIKVATHQVRRMRGQPRTHFDGESLARLGASMESAGQIYPGIVRAVRDDAPIKYELIDGERRWRAAKQCGLPYRALLVKVDDEAASFLIAATANFNREAHTPIEVSDAIREMLAIEMPMPEIASVLGLSEFWAAQMFGLQQLTRDVRSLMDPTLPKDKRLPVTAAVQISKCDASLQLTLAKKVLARKLTLGGLRGEAVRASHAAGVPIRERGFRPSESWRSLVRGSEWLETRMRDLETLVTKDDVLSAFRERSVVEVRKTTDRLRSAASVCLRIAAALEQVHARKAS